MVYNANVKVSRLNVWNGRRNMEKDFAVFKCIFGLQHAFFQVLHSQLGGMEAHPRQGPILGMLLHADGLSQADLVREMNVSAATVAVSLARLEKLGFVTRQRNQSNQRANVLALTEKGRQEAARMEQVMRELGQVALTGFSGQEIKEIITCFQRMKSNLHQHYHMKECVQPHASDD